MAEPDFRSLCAELLRWADKASAHYVYVKPDLFARARAALAQPAPEPDPEPVIPPPKALNNQSTPLPGLNALAEIAALAQPAPMVEPNPNPPLWRVMKNTIYTHDRWSATIRAVADEVERRGAKGLDLDPGETADWLRSEADRADAETLRHGMKMAPGQWEAGL